MFAAPPGFEHGGEDVRAETRSRDIVVLHAIETDLCIFSFRGSKLEFRVAHVVNKSC